MVSWAPQLHALALHNVHALHNLHAHVNCMHAGRSSLVSHDFGFLWRASSSSHQPTCWHIDGMYCCALVALTIRLVRSNLSTQTCVDAHACRWYDLVLAAEDDIATIMTMEGGKPLKESKGEFASG